MMGQQKVKTSLGVTGTYSEAQVEAFKQMYPVGMRARMFGTKGDTVRFYGTVVAVNKMGINIEWDDVDRGVTFQTAAKPGIDRFDLITPHSEELQSYTDFVRAQ